MYFLELIAENSGIKKNNIFEGHTDCLLSQQCLNSDFLYQFLQSTKFIIMWYDFIDNLLKSNLRNVIR